MDLQQQLNAVSVDKVVIEKMHNDLIVKIFELNKSILLKDNDIILLNTKIKELEETLCKQTPIIKNADASYTTDL